MSDRLERDQSRFTNPVRYFGYYITEPVPQPKTSFQAGGMKKANSLDISSYG
jgi:hypothetical protein